MTNLFGCDSRSKKVSKNIIASFAIKSIDTFVYLALIPLTIGYLNPYEYGIWLTINSILIWINSFDIGLGNGLRNKLAEAEAQENKNLARTYVSTTFFMLIGIMSIIAIIGGFLIYVINWYEILGVTEDSVPNLGNIVLLSFAIFCLNFVVKFIGNVYLALQLPAINNLIVSSGHLLALLVIWVLTKTTSGSLLFVAVAYSISPVVIYSIAYPITFYCYFKYLSPSLKYFNAKYLKSLVSVGIQFFLLQAAGIVLFSFSNIIISREFGPDKVTPYNIAYRYFSMMSMVTGLISAPMWSATTDAFVRGEYLWIKNVIKKIQKVIMLMTGGLVLMVVLSNVIYKLWVGNDVEIPILMSSLMAVYVFVLMWSTSYSNFLNGMGKLRLQTINTVVEAIIFYPVCLFLSAIWGIYGVLIGMVLVNGLGMVLNIIQTHLILNNRATGLFIN